MKIVGHDQCIGHRCNTFLLPSPWSEYHAIFPKYQQNHAYFVQFIADISNVTSFELEARNICFKGIYGIRISGSKIQPGTFGDRLTKNLIRHPVYDPIHILLFFFCCTSTYCYKIVLSTVLKKILTNLSR